MNIWILSGLIVKSKTIQKHTHNVLFSFVFPLLKVRRSLKEWRDISIFGHQILETKINQMMLWIQLGYRFIHAHRSTPIIFWKYVPMQLCSSGLFVEHLAMLIGFNNYQFLPGTWLPSLYILLYYIALYHDTGTWFNLVGGFEYSGRFATSTARTPMIWWDDRTFFLT